MVNLRTMKASEFPAYCDYFVPDFAAELTSNYGYPMAKSVALARKDIEDDLPQGVATPKNILLCIEQEQRETIGYLWYLLNDDKETIFIMDFVILESFRGQGLGKASLAALETYLADSDISQIKLRVAYDNTRAQKLYERMGFTPTGINMIKQLPKPESD